MKIDKITTNYHLLHEVLFTSISCEVSDVYQTVSVDMAHYFSFKFSDCIPCLSVNFNINLLHSFLPDTVVLLPSGNVPLLHLVYLISVQSKIKHSMRYSEIVSMV